MFDYMKDTEHYQKIKASKLFQICTVCDLDCNIAKVDTEFSSNLKKFKASR